MAKTEQLKIEMDADRKVITIKGFSDFDSMLHFYKIMHSKRERFADEKTQASAMPQSANKDFTAQSVSPKVCPYCQSNYNPNNFKDEYKHLSRGCLYTGKPS